jgi:hypothetical protein
MKIANLSIKSCEICVDVKGRKSFGRSITEMFTQYLEEKRNTFVIFAVFQMRSGTS